MQESVGLIISCENELNGFQGHLVSENCFCATQSSNFPADSPALALFSVFFHYSANPSPLLPWIMDSWLHSFFKPNGTTDLGPESRGITETHVRGVTSTLPALLFADGWRSVLTVGWNQLLVEAQARSQIFQLLKATFYLQVQAFHGVQLPSTWWFFSSLIV